ncbi:MAG TPA: STN domain-containing protein [Pirellulales bacterium]|jgi:hypothetical protein
MSTTRAASISFWLMLAVVLLMSWLTVVRSTVAAQLDSNIKALARNRAGDRQARATAHRGRVGRLPQEAAPPKNFLTADQLARLGPISYTAINSPLRQALRSLSQALRVAIVVDRRIDPDQSVDIELVDVPLDEALAVIAKRAGGGASILGPVVYIGPQETAGQLRTLSALATQEVQKLPARQKSAALLSRPLDWQALTTPQQVFERLAKEASIPIRGQERLPHDLLAATDLPALSWIDRVTLTAAQFGLRPKPDAAGGSLELMPIDEDVRLERSYPAGRDGAKTVADWQKRASEATVKLSGGRIIVRATVEDHERLSPTRTERTPNTTPGQQVYTLSLEGMKLETFLAQLEQKLSLSFELAGEGIKLDAPVNVDVKNASLDELLRAAFEPLGLEFRRRDKAVTVRAKEKS